MDYYEQNHKPNKRSYGDYSVTIAVIALWAYILWGIAGIIGK